ncbi:sure-like protein [Saccharata proteae CBS 121410]|uniref:Sure-like protein n=1 Tax=Saccharata proteae CBS 121410 TaxID=1314787 RepID=A0A9P4HSR2_9PEZI|nr:sure-like protein [Saccharata proteae CBS 121410]
MHILITNDDGPPSNLSSPYIHPFISELRSAGHTVSVVLPHTQRSWIGKAHIVGQPIKPTYYRPAPLEVVDGVFNNEGTVSERPLRTISGSGEDEWLLIDSTPASCAQIGLHHYFKEKGPIDLVISGPNYGRNTTAVFALSSGTIGGALEAAVCGARAIALSFAFFDRNHDAGIIGQACRHGVKVVEYLAAHGEWDDGSGKGGAMLYSVNVPLAEGVEGRKTLWTDMLENRWGKGRSCFQVQEMEEDEGAEEAEKKIREDEGREGGKEESDGKEGFRHVHFKWAPTFQDVHESVERSGEGNDGWAVRERFTSVTPLRANFMHAPFTRGELKI